MSMTVVARIQPKMRPKLAGRNRALEANLGTLVRLDRPC